MHKSLAWLLTGVVIVLAFVFASYIVFMQFRPEQEIQRMLAYMANVTSLEQDGGFSWTMQERDARINTTVYTRGSIQITPTPQINHSTTFRVVYLSEDDSYQDLSGELRSLYGRSYLTYASPGPEVPGVNFKKSTWVEFAQGELPAWGEILPGLDVPLETLLSPQSWTAEGLERLRFVITHADIAHVEYKGETEEVDGVEARIIDGQFDAEALFAFLLDLVRANEGRQPSDAERIVASRQAHQLSRLTLRFWIGIPDHFLYRFQAAGGFEQIEGTDLIPVDVRIDLRIPDSELAIEAPNQTILFEDIFHAVLGVLPNLGLGSGGSVLTLVTDESAKLSVTETVSSSDSDGDGLDNILEAFYGTSSSNADTDGDGMNDGDEVHAGRNPRGSGSLFGFGF